MLLLRKALSHKECVIVCILERKAGSACHSSQRIFSYVELNVDLLCKTLGKSSEEGSASGKMDTVFHDVCVKLRWSLLKYVDDAAFNTCHRLVQTVCDLLMSDGSVNRMGSHQVRAYDVLWLRFFHKVRNDSSDGDLDLFCRDLSHLDVVLLAEIHLNVIGEHVTSHFDGILHYDTSE